MIVYHGTTLRISKPDLAHTKAFLDFGPAFYLTEIVEQAKAWALRKKEMLGAESAIVNEYELNVAMLGNYRVKRFDETNEAEWLDFVCDSRDGKEVYADYDAIIGPVGDDKIFKIVHKYHSGEWTAEKALSELKFQQKSNQIAVRNAELLDVGLVFRSAYEVQTEAEK